MDKLKIIYKLLKIAKYFPAGGAVIVVLFFIFLPDGPVELAGPYYVINDSELVREINELLPKGEEISFEIRTSLIAPMTPSFRMMICSFVAIVAAFFFYLIHLAQQVVAKIRTGHSFTIENIKRIKVIGTLVMLSIFGEKILTKLFESWFQSNYEFEGMKLINESELGWYIAIIGAIIYALGFAFEQGLKLQEEQDLTI